MTIPGRHFAQNLVLRRTLLFQLVRRDFETRFIGSAVGWLWGLIHPVVLLVSWVFVFQVCMHATLPPNEVTHNYSLFLFCGFLPWLLFQETVVRSASSLLENTNLITKTVFPSEIVPVSIFLSSLISHLMALASGDRGGRLLQRALQPVDVFLAHLYGVDRSAFRLASGGSFPVSRSIFGTPRR